MGRRAILGGPALATAASLEDDPCFRALPHGFHLARRRLAAQRVHADAGDALVAPRLEPAESLALEGAAWVVK